MPTESAIPDATLVTAREHLEELTGELSGCRRLALDSESNGFYAYREKVCLLQLTANSCDYIIDPLAISDLSALGPLMADPSIEKIFHAGEYDILCLKRDYGFSFANVFDTMIAGRLLGDKELGLAAIIAKHFGVKLSKKLQRADWGKRPLTLAHLRYAQMDTHYLSPLCDIQKKLLEQKDRLEDAAEAFAALTRIVPVTKTFDPEGFWRLAGGHRLDGRQLARLRELYLLREHFSEESDRAPFRVMPEDLLVRLSVETPKNHEALSKIRGMSPYLLSKFGFKILAALERGASASAVPEKQHSGRPRQDPREWKIYEELRQWRKRSAEKTGIDPVDVVSGDCLKDIARRAFAKNGDPLEGLSTLKRRRYAEELREMLKKLT